MHYPLPEMSNRYLLTNHNFSHGGVGQLYCQYTEREQEMNRKIVRTNLVNQSISQYYNFTRVRCKLQ